MTPYSVALLRSSCFFVISGFCIHYPFADGRKIAAEKFLLRRYVRIGIPALIVVGLSQFLPDGLPVMWRLLLWSLYCEIVYYTLYPLLNTVSRRIGWNWLILGSFFLLVIFLTFTHAASTNLMYAGMNIWDPVLGLPCWLLGCKVADLVHHKHPMKFLGNIGFLRLGGWILSSLSFGLMLHAGVSFSISLSIFAIYAAFWLWAEVVNSTVNSFPRWLEWAGATSYSLYLTHPLSANLYQVTVPSSTSNVGLIVSWVGQLVFILAVSIFFWLVVENPVHRFARTLGR